MIRILTICFTICLLLCAPVYGGLIGFYEGNDNAETVSEIVNEDVFLLGKIETEGYDVSYQGQGNKFGFTYEPSPESFAGINYPHYLASKLNGESEFRSGKVFNVSYSGDIDYFAAKAGKGFYLYEWDDEVDFQYWNTKCTDLSHLSFYGTHLPEPSGFTMTCFAILCIVGWLRVKREHK